jgi:hypothetical protein
MLSKKALINLSNIKELFFIVRRPYANSKLKLTTVGWLLEYFAGVAELCGYINYSSTCPQFRLIEEGVSSPYL